MDNLGDRMKHNYEEAYKIRLPYRMPVIIRLDGKAFHSLPFNKPYDDFFMDVMDAVTASLCRQVQGTVFAYTQSDEISLLLHNYKKLTSQAWFDNEIQKMCSISASIASSEFTVCFSVPVQFDSRVFVIPEAEVCNYFIWRQDDWERNSIQMLAQSLYSHKQLNKKNCEELKKMCIEKGQNWDDMSLNLQRGRCFIHTSGTWEQDNNIPLFKEDRNYINNLLKVEEE